MMEALAVALVLGTCIGAGVLGWKSWGWTKQLLRRRRAIGPWRYIGRDGEPPFENGWDNCSSDPIKDIEEVLARGFEEGWSRDVPLR